MGERQPRRLQQRSQVVHRAARVHGRIAGDELAGRRIDRNLSRHEEELPDPESRRVSAGGIGSVGTRDRLLHAAFVTLPDRRQRVHTLMRLLPPPMRARTV